jgi:cation-transporting P-type ATPase I
MVLGLLIRPAAGAAELVSAGPRLLARGAAPVVGAAAGAVAGTARAGVRGADCAVRLTRAARGALPGRPRHWRSGRRAHLALRLAGPGEGGTEGEGRRAVGADAYGWESEPARESRRGAGPDEHRAGVGAEEGGARSRKQRTERAARRVAEALAERPDVAFAYWDGGLRRLVVTAAEDAVGDRVLEHATELAARHGLAQGVDDVEEFAHPADPAGIRAAAAALAADGLGIAAGLLGYSLRLPPSPRAVTALVTLARENPRFRSWLRARLGRSRMDVVMALTNAAAHGAGQTPTALVLDGVLRVCQLVETLGRVAAFDAVHDQVVGPERSGVPADLCPRPPLRPSPAQDYAAHASAGSLAGAAAALLVKHDGAEAAEAVLAGSPKAARYGPAAFNAVLSAALSRTGALVRDTERLRQLEMADTVVLHPSALCAPGAGVDPWAEPLLDAARRAGLRVVMVDDPALADFTGLTDQVEPAGRSLSEVVGRLRDEDRTVVTVARPRSADDTGVLTGLLAGDVAVALVDGDGTVVWGADVLALHGPADVWRLLTAVPAARTLGRRSQTLARSGAALSGLLVAVGESPRGQRTPLPGLRHAPVDASAAVALLSGTRAALRVAMARAPHPHARVAWHELEPVDIRDRLERETGERPTALQEAATRAGKAAGAVGRHPALAPARWTAQLARAVRGELDDPLTPVLAVGSAAEAILGSAMDALLVLGALDLNALVGGVQRLRAERALARLLAQQKQKAHVVDTEEETPPAEYAPPHETATQGAPTAPHTVDATDLRAGHVIELQADDVVPADGRLLWHDGLEVDESALTGESLPVEKQTDPTPHAAVADRRCMVFEGTTVVAGHARAVVVDTGDDTEAARAVHLAARTPPSAGVQARLQQLTRRALPLTMAGGAAVTGLALVRGTPIREAVSGGVAVAVAAVPEGLPLVATVAQLAAARRLSRRGVLVRTPRTLEALGRMDTICFDKTGTLTENRLRLTRISDSEGTVRERDQAGSASTLRAAARACPQLNGGSDRPVHATDEAVLDAARPDPDWVQFEGRPFEAGRGYAAAVGRAADGPRTLVVKGAPETVLPSCPGLPSHASDTAHALARDGLRVLAVAERRLRDDEAETDVLEEPLHELEFTGLLALADAPRETSPALLHGLDEAGVRPVMLTGDHPQTARAIAADLGWPTDTAVITGDELTAADRSARARMLRNVGVVARVAPEQKLQVVEALREAGRVVAMVGDGANDAAAIRAADVGVGINARGSAAARNAADLVLTEDDLSVLIDAVHEGRALWHSVADAIAILIGGNAGEVGFGILGTLLSGRAPLSTRQMLMVNLFTDLFPAMAVAVTPNEAAQRAAAGTPEDTADVLGAPLVEQIRHRALTTTLGATAAWLFGRFTPGTARRSGTMALCGVVGTQLAQTLLDRRDSPLVQVTSVGSGIALVALIQTPGVSHFLGCTPVGPLAWLGIAASIALALSAQRSLPRLEETVQRLIGRSAHS